MTKDNKGRERWQSGKLKVESRLGYKCYFDQCHGCIHTFYPKRLTFKQLQSREVCPCMCHWGDDYSGGITYQEALTIFTKQKDCPS